jgi:hypothetical protein
VVEPARPFLKGTQSKPRRFFWAYEALFGELKVSLSTACRAVAGNALTLGFEAGKGRPVRDQTPSPPLNGFALAPEGETGALPTASMDRPLASSNT